MKTKVKFLMNENYGEIPDLFAFFPEDVQNVPGDKNYPLFGSYSRVGQHSACCQDYANESRPATPEEYAGLKTELESIGYKLEII